MGIYQIPHKLIRLLTIQRKNEVLKFVLILHWSTRTNKIVIIIIIIKQMKVETTNNCVFNVYTEQCWYHIK